MKKALFLFGVLFALASYAVEPYAVFGKAANFNTYGNAKAERQENGTLRLQLGGVNDGKGGALQFFLKAGEVKAEEAYDSVTVTYRGDGGTGSFVLIVTTDSKHTYVWNGKIWEPSAAIACHDTGTLKRVFLLKDFQYAGSGNTQELKPEAIRSLHLAIGPQLTDPSRKLISIEILGVAFEKGAKEEYTPAPKESTQEKAPAKPLPSPTVTSPFAYNLPSWINWDVQKHFQKNTATRNSISLNNYWQFRPIPESLVARVMKERKGVLPPFPEAVPQDGFDQYIRVPGRWDGNGYRMRNAEKSPITKINNELPAEYTQGWLRRSFYAPETWRGKNIRLQLGGIGEQAAVFLNGVPCGNFSKTGVAEIGDAVFFGQSNNLSIFVQYSTLPVSPTHARHKEFMNPGMGATWWYNWHDGAGLTEDVWLHVLPKTVMMNDLRAIPEVSKGRLRADTEVINHDTESQKLILSGKVLDGAETVLEFPREIITLKPGETLRCGLDTAWNNAVCWSPDNPKLYDLQLTLRDTKGNIVDELQDRFGYRELTVKDGDFLLNGTKIRLKFESCQFRFGSLEEDELRRILTELKKMHFNGIILESMSERVVRVCNEIGMMIAIRHVMPSLVRGGVYLPGVPNHGYPFEVYLSPRFAKAKAELESTLEEIVRTFRNSPAIVIWMTNPLLCWNPEWINPNLIDVDRPENDLVRATMAEERFLREFDPTRLTIQSMSSSTGSVITANPYPTLSNQPDEWADWPMRWSERKKKPLILEEVSVTFGSNYANFHSKSKKRNTTWDETRQMFYEQSARYFGDAVYESSSPDTEDFDWYFMVDKKIKNAQESYSILNPATTNAVALWIRRCLSAWRIYDVSGIWPFDSIFLYFNLGEKTVADLPEPADITAPGSKRDFANSRDYSRPNRIHEETRRMQQPFLAFLGGRSGRFTSQEHAYTSGETVQKQMLFSNDAPHPITVTASWRIGKLASGNYQGVLQAGEVKQIPFEWIAPEVTARSEYQLEFQAEGDGIVCKDSLALQVFPAEASRPKKAVVLYDENGLAREMFAKLKLSYGEDWNSLAPGGTLVVGPDSFSAAFLAKARVAGLEKQLKDGVSLLILEQSDKGAMKDYLEERRVRNVFIKDANHPILAGIAAGDLHHWRGEPAFPEPYPNEKTAVNGMRFMRWGTEGAVSCFVLDKPDTGRFNVLLDADADLSRAALLEYPVGKGRIVFCQLSLSNRCGTDPVATRIAEQLFAYLENPEVFPEIPAGVAGNGKLLKELGFRPSAFDPTRHRVGVWTSESKIPAATLRAFVESGGTLLILGADAKAIADLDLPFTLTAEREKTRLGDWPKNCPLLRGLGNSDFYFNPAVSLTALKNWPKNAQFSSKLFGSVPYGKGRYVFLALKLSDFKEESSQIKVRRIISTVLFRLGVPAEDRVDFANLPGDILLTGVKVPFQTDPDSTGMEKGYLRPELDENNWKSIVIGSPWEGQGITMPNLHYKAPDGLPYDGDAWYRIGVIIPPEWRGRELYFDAETIDDLDWVYFNGVLIGETGQETPNYWSVHRRYRIPTELIRFGKQNLIAVRVRDLRGNGGILGKVRVGGETERPANLFYSRPSRLIFDFDPNTWRQW
ncbi:MAG: hypothetical protein LBM70_04600 [Victivallales bacterium]|nr:hypothetical protein [Victivallales bacterium]